MNKIIKRSQFSISIFFLTLTTSLAASPWIDPGDERLRHHITVLADSGVIQSPITSWPLMWGAISSDLANIDTATLTETQAWSLEYVQFHYNQAKQTIKGYAYVGAQTDVSAITSFATDQREKTEMKSELDWVGQRFAWRLRATWADDASDGKDFRYDGSYVAGAIGNWSINVGAIDRWWGPGWQSSLILSSNARPVNAVSVQRNFSDAFDWPVLSWFGPWTFTTFIGQLESDRAVPDAKLVGARLTFKPINALEIGFARAAQWGGEGRPESLSSLTDLMLGNDNVGDDGIDASNEPGNQLGAIDWRLGGSVFGTNSAFYMQYVGEDESNGFPTRGIYLYGIESAFLAANVQNRLIVEYSDTVAGGDRYNVAYEHSPYQSGYRYRGRPLGASFDNDSKVLSLGGSHYFAEGHEFDWRFSKLKINQDGTNTDRPAGGNVFGSDTTNTAFLELKYAMIFSDLKVSTAVTHVTDELNVYGQTINGTGVSIAFEYKP